MKESALTLVFDDRAPLYRQLYRYLAGEIQGGRLAAGTRLPSKRQLCAHLGISMSTVETAYGPIRSKTGTGYGVTKSKWEYEDLAAAARRAGVPLAKVLEDLRR